MANDSAQWSQPFPTKKIRSRSFSLRPEEFDHLAVAVMSGSFNPVHTQHIRAMELARIALEREGWTILGGFLAPSSDTYLQAKLNSNEFSFGWRADCCRMATQDSEWLDVCSLGEYSTYRASTRIREQVERQCGDLLQGRTITGVEVMGSDTAIRIIDKLIDRCATADVAKPEPWYDSRIVCCVLRPGSKSTAEAERILTYTAPRAEEIGIAVRLVDGAQEGLQLEPVCSTDVRDLVQRHDWEGLRARRWLHPEVLRALEKDFS